MHPVILNMLVTKDLDKKVFEYIDPWAETLEYIAWEIRASYTYNIWATPGQAVFCRDMIFNLVSVVEWQVRTAGKQLEVDINNFL